MAFKATKEQIADWKKKHGTIYQLKADDGSVCILRKPDRNVMSHATAVAGNEPIRFNEIILNDCWLGGDENMREDDAKFMAISAQLSSIIEIAEVELKKL